MRRIAMGNAKFLMTLQLKTQGKITGSSTKHEGSLDTPEGIECHSFNYAVISPRDAASGLPSGKRTHKPIVVTREVDEASPLLWQALCTNEGFEVAKLSFLEPSGSGKETIHQTITLTNGTISKIEYAPPLMGKKRQAITFSYEELAVNGAKGVVIPLSLMG
jgi:type VI secretion system secreted protein Hcp